MCGIAPEGGNGSDLTEWPRHFTTTRFDLVVVVSWPVIVGDVRLVMWLPLSNFCFCCSSIVKSSGDFFSVFGLSFWLLSLFG